MSAAQQTNQSGNVSRRDFMKVSTATGLTALLAGAPRGAYAAGSDKIRVGLIGCGGRGTGAGIIDCANSSKGVELVAIADVFPERLAAAPGRIKSNLKRRNLPVEEIYKVTPDTTFSGFDAYKKLLKCDLDMVILTNPPYFRPMQFRACIEAGKHVFMEKPVAVDPAGVRSVIETSQVADQKGLNVVAGTQMRRARHIIATIDRLRQGDIGEFLAGQAMRIGGGLMNWYSESKKRKAEWSDLEWQMRRWLFVTWLSGDFIVEQHVHNLDLLNWAMGSKPLRCIGLGGRQARTGPEYGNVWDHIAVEYEYPGDVRIEYMGSQIDGTSGRNDLRLIGDKGKAYIDFAEGKIEGAKPFRYDGPSVKPAVQEYADLIASIRAGEKLNEGKRIAESTLTAIMGRMSAYTGRALKWDWVMKASKLKLGPETVEGFGPFEMQEVAIPGKTKLV